MVEVHRRLEVGEVILQGETLFVIDPRIYSARLEDAKAVVEQFENSIERVRTQWANDRDRLKTLKRSRDLAKAEYERVKRLFEQDQVGTQSAVDNAERAYNTAVDQVDQLERALAVYPIQIKETQNGLASARAKLDLAEYDMERSRVAAPFDARVKEVSLEVGQYVTPGVSVLTLANDAVLEISVPLDSREARRWLVFNGEGPGAGLAWFRGLEPVACRVRWTEDPEDHHWEGRLHRVEKFDHQTRTLTVAVRIEGADALSKDPDQLPLVEGMFCAVEIPGCTLRGVYRVPNTAVNFDGTAYVAVDGRLRTVPIEAAYVSGDFTYVSKGLSPGDIVVTTRLVNPLENTLLDVRLEGEEKSEAQAGIAPSLLRRRRS